jgi:hypothetical protein
MKILKNESNCNGMNWDKNKKKKQKWLVGALSDVVSWSPRLLHIIHNQNPIFKKIQRRARQFFWLPFAIKIKFKFALTHVMTLKLLNHDFSCFFSE